MAQRPSPNSLIHCAICGEDYSATYKRCPFCGAKNAAPSAPPPLRRRTPAPEPEPEPRYRAAEPEPAPEPSRRPPADPDDTYVFDGQDLFDEEPEDDYPPAYPKGGKRLAEKPSSSPFANAEINWPRVITFLCSLVIIIAALVIVFTGIYPKLRGGKDPVAEADNSSSPAVTQPAGEPTQPAGPPATDPGAAATDPGAADTDPPADPSTEPPLTGPDDGNLVSMSFKGGNDADFTLKEGEAHTITLNFNPASWAGPVTWSSSNSEIATVDASGRVTNVNSSDRLRSAVITATAGGISLQSKVFCRGKAAAVASDPPATQLPAQPDPPATATQAPPSGGNIAVGRQGTIVNAEGGLNVRPDPSTSNPAIATLRNGNTVTVLAPAEGGWYQVSFTGSGGSTVTGYIMGDYISMD